jgi:hypothetical protein
MEISWQKCAGDVWGSLLGVNLRHPHFDNLEGIYIIWQANGPVIRVGQGIIRDRLSAHRLDPEVTAYDPLHVTWAPVSLFHRNGVEKYLANTLKPKVGEAFPDAIPMAVVLPWPWIG